MLQKVTRVVVFRRVSTERQGKSGLGMEAQAKAVADYIALHGAEVVGDFEEVESGRAKERVVLKEAIATAKAKRAVLLVAKLDRVGRRASEVLTLLDRRDIRIVFADSPDASQLENGIRAIVAEEEARAISARTKAALAAAKARKVKLGCPNGARALLAYQAKEIAKGLDGNEAACEGASKAADIFALETKPYLIKAIAAKLSNARIAAGLNEQGICTRREGASWHETSVRNLRKRLAI
jgi:DNA invertase Pin-like site-specific DNA recombinase